MPETHNVGSYDSLAREIVAWHTQAVSSRRPRGSGRILRRPLARRFDKIYSQLADFSAQPASSEAAGVEWLLDNHHVVLSALIQLGQDLPPGHFNRLPGVRSRAGRPVPRLAEMTGRLLAATELPLDLISLQVALESVQVRLPLQLSELWALPSFLRMHLLKRLADTADRMLQPPFSARAVPLFA